MDENSRITSPILNLGARLLSWSMGIIDPVVFLVFTEKYREEVKGLFRGIPFVGSYIAKVWPEKKSKSNRKSEITNRKSNVTSKIVTSQTDSPTKDETNVTTA